MRTAHLVAVGAEDDAAIESLSDIARILAPFDDVVVIGGHMVSILTAAYPSPGFVERRTGDSDAGISVELAATGQVHDALTAAGYVAESGNRYTKDDRGDTQPTIDLLIPSLNGAFHSEEHGGRAFDASPGLSVALHAASRVRVIATTLSENEVAFEVNIPTVEAAVLLKAHSWASRLAQKDVIDLNNLLSIVDHNGYDTIAPWRLNEPGLIGSRRDAARYLHRLAGLAEANRLSRSPIDPRRLTVLIRRHISAV
ncbi:hypothetical protein [Agromyces neolithicus]|uniref:Nucleotidyl transferase AbiEii/AbiGii toxin family protein n=1 Tax=Agromyces neolithicus TaxID=269420 RepID=A0ABN2M1R1_9MICO